MPTFLLPFTLFAIAGSFTPGPNNIMLAASGVNFGFRRTLPHMLGVCVGLPLMVMAIGLGLSQLFKDRKSTRLNSSHIQKSRMPSSA